MFTTPVLFLIFNKPNNTRRVFERIREIRPSKLYIAADGPRTSKKGEKEKCNQARSILNDIDWECEVKTLFRGENLGCKRAVAEAITWFFNEEELGIILEDDCLPDLSFFPFCGELLERYKNDERIGHIGGNCFLPGVIEDNVSYDFCSITHIWGWATWRRVWKKVDINFSYWNTHKKNRKSLFCNKFEEIYFTSFIQDALTHRKGLDPWGVFYYYSLRLQNYLSIYPKVNLVTNIGLNSEDATHTKRANHKLFVPYQSITFPLKHPLYILNNKNINEKAIFFNFFSYKRIMRYFLKLY